MQKLSEQLQTALQNLAIASPNALQVAALQAQQQPKDMVLLAPTGSGKTLAFLLPLLQQLNSRKKGPQALVLAPSRELALQIESVFKKMGTPFYITCCYGGHAVRVEKNNLAAQPDVIIGTPGRVADHLRRGHFSATHIKTIVFDEFDKALEFGFHKEMSEIMEMLGTPERRILTSATHSIDIPAFTGVKDPKVLDFTVDALPKGLKLKTVRSNEQDKPEVLLKLLGTVHNQTCLVFCNHREAVERISNYLNRYDVINACFHGGLEQEVRERTLAKLRNGSTRILIATDLAARGLDIPEIKCVIHYQMPPQQPAFIHRNGRTARMHAEGTAYLLLSTGDAGPEYLRPLPPSFLLPETIRLPEKPDWATLYIGVGKKDKVNKIDVVGFLSKIGGLQKDELGRVEIRDRCAYAAVQRKKLKTVLQKVCNQKIKGKKAKVNMAR